MQEGTVLNDMQTDINMPFVLKVDVSMNLI